MAIDPNSPLERAIRVIGSAERLAERVGVTPQAVSRWRRTRVPAERVLSVEFATDLQVTRHELRPDVFGPVEEVTAHG